MELKETADKETRRPVERRNPGDQSSSTDKIHDDVELTSRHPPTTYLDTLMHLIKAYCGSGVFGMADAIKNSGIIVGGLCTILIACIYVHMQHILANASDFQMITHNLAKRPGFADTLEMCVINSKSERLRGTASIMKKCCNIMICMTQLGVCCVFFVFVSSNVKNVLDFHGYVIDIHILMLYLFIPIWLTSLVGILKYMAIFSTIANFCMIAGIILTVIFAAQDLPPISEREYFAGFTKLPLFFGTAMFAFDGIAFVLPLKNEMRNPNQFGKSYGVLNVGMILVTISYVVIGEIGYWKYGEETAGSLTVNLPTQFVFLQIVKVIISIGVLLGYTLQLYVPVQIIYPAVAKSWKLAQTRPVIAELTFRSILVVGTLIVAEIVPNLSLLLSLVGVVCCSVLGFVFPVLIEMISLHNEETGIKWWVWIKNGVIILIALAGFIFGAFFNIKEIIEQF